MIYLALLLVFVVSFILSTLVFGLVGFGLGWELIIRPAMAAGRDGQFIGCTIMLFLVIGLTIALTQEGIHLLEPCMPELPQTVPTVPTQQRSLIPYTHVLFRF